MSNTNEINIQFNVFVHWVWHIKYNAARCKISPSKEYDTYFETLSLVKLKCYLCLGNSCYVVETATSSTEVCLKFWNRDFVIKVETRDLKISRFHKNFLEFFLKRSSSLLSYSFVEFHAFCHLFCLYLPEDTTEIEQGKVRKLYQAIIVEH